MSTRIPSNQILILIQDVDSDELSKLDTITDVRYQDITYYMCDRNKTVKSESVDFFKAISEQDVVFYRGHVRTSIVPFVTKIDNDFYIYAQLFGKEPNNYSIVIEDAKYFEFSKIIEKDIVKNLLDLLKMI